MICLKMKKILIALFFCFLSFSSAHAEEITVSAAISLNNAFKEIGSSFEKLHPDTKILFNFAGSGALLQQIDKGAPVDVFASADEKTMDMANEKNLIDKETRRSFAQNKLVLTAPIASKISVSGLSDLTSVKRIAIANPDSVPAGRYAKMSLEKSGLWDKTKEQHIYTQNVRQTLDYVARDEVDVGFVYSSDANHMNDKVKVLFEVPLDIPVTYPIARITTSKHTDTAQKFIDYVLSAEGQAILKKYGFSSMVE